MWICRAARAPRDCKRFLSYRIFIISVPYRGAKIKYENKPELSENKRRSERLCKNTLEISTKI